MSMGIGAFADGETTPTYTITIDNTSNQNVSIVGKTFKAYKIFDMTYSGTTTTDVDSTPHSYTISTSNPFYTDTDAKAELDKYFSFTPSASDATVMVVGIKDTAGKAPGETGYDETKPAFTETTARTLADALEDYLPSTDNGAVTATAETATINTDPNAAGYYIVYGTVKPNDPANANQELVAALALTSTDPTGAVKPKVDAPPLEKEITQVAEGTTKVDDAVLDDAGKAAVAKVGSTVSYKLTSSIPDLTGYTDYTFRFEDKLSAGLDYVSNSFALTIKGTTENIAPVFAEDNKSFTLTIPFATLNKEAYSKGDPIILTYNCTVNSSALTYDYENNTANLVYSHSPYDTTTNKTPDKETYVIDLNLDVLKVDGADSTKKLDGAKFVLYREVTTTTPPAEEGGEATTSKAKQYYKWVDNKVTWVSEQSAADVFETDTNGNLKQQVRGLDQGTYYLLETEAPKGYNLLKDAVEVVITATPDSEEAVSKVTYSATYAGEDASMTNGEVNLATAQQESGKQPVATGTIENNSGVELPSTGGIGTTIFYVVGSIMVVAAGVLLVTKKRMSREG